MRSIVKSLRGRIFVLSDRIFTLGGGISQFPKRILLNNWSAIYAIIAKLNRVIPMSGAIRDQFEDIVFKRHWNRWYKIAYVPENRDRFFEHIVTFFYRYPIRKGDVVVEVGASSGEEAIRFARAVGRTGRLIAVEPEAGNLAKLAECFPKDRFPQVTIVPKGAWKEKTELPFFTGGEKEHRLADLGAKELTYEWWGVTDHLQERRYKGVTTVQVDTIDNIVAETGVKSIDFVLLEMNGAELEGILGMDASFAIAKRIAARGHVMRDGVPIYKEIEPYLKSKGFETAVTSEGMVLAQRPVGWRMQLKTIGDPA
jgi:FkbM family methyltransferase